VATWRHFARSMFPKVVRELQLPAATSDHGGLTTCPKHGELIGPVTHLCASCFEEAWAEVGRRYASAEQGAGNQARGGTDAGVTD
jgi:hypothetical protein